MPQLVRVPHQMLHSVYDLATVGYRHCFEVQSQHAVYDSESTLTPTIAILLRIVVRIVRVVVDVLVLDLKTVRRRV